MRSSYFRGLTLLADSSPVSFLVPLSMSACSQARHNTGNRREQDKHSGVARQMLIPDHLNYVVQAIDMNILCLLDCVETKNILVFSAEWKTFSTIYSPIYKIRINNYESRSWYTEEGGCRFVNV